MALDTTLDIFVGRFIISMLTIRILIYRRLFYVGSAANGAL